MLDWGLSAEDQDAGIFQYANADEPSLAMTTGGMRTLSSEHVSSSVNAWADPVTGMFKSYTGVQISGNTATNIVSAYTSFGISDTVRFFGATDFVDVAFHLSYDTLFEGLGLEPFDRVGSLSHFMQAWSNRGISLNWEVPNPNFNPDAECVDEGEVYYCPDEAIEYYSSSINQGFSLFREWALGGPNGVYSNGDAENGLYSDTVSFVVNLPVNIDIMLDYSVFNSSRCFHLQSCDLSVNALNSDYIRMEVLNDATFTSSNGYQYLGNTGSNPTPVPAPATILLMLTGFGVIVGRRSLKIR